MPAGHTGDKARRQEVASLAGASVEYYTAIEGASWKQRCSRGKEKGSQRVKKDPTVFALRVKFRKKNYTGARGKRHEKEPRKMTMSLCLE